VVLLQENKSDKLMLHAAQDIVYCSVIWGASVPVQQLDGSARSVSPLFKQYCLSRWTLSSVATLSVPQSDVHPGFMVLRVQHPLLTSCLVG
jgi:hypothetical protein